MVVEILRCSGRSSQNGDAELNESLQLEFGHCWQVSWNRDCRHWLTYEVEESGSKVDNDCWAAQLYSVAGCKGV